jgi:penicillin-binding protein 2
MKVFLRFWRCAIVFLVVLLVAQFTLATDAKTTTTRRSTAKQARVSDNAKARRNMSRLRHHRRVASRRRRSSPRYRTSSFANDATEGDITEGEDPIVRAAAVDALGNMNGTVVAIEPSTGRILAMVNQKLALSAGAQPCSTIKIPVALAAIEEGIVDKDTEIQVGRRSSISMTEALAHSNNPYFEALGRKLGFKKVQYYSHLFGLGELAGYEIDGEQRGVYPAKEISARLGGVGKMCSFGEGVSMTPLQLGALTAALANGGTLYYLQHPESPDEMEDFQPRTKRHLDLTNVLPEIRDGMLGAVHYGTARHLRTSFTEEEVLGKTGTCSHAGTRLGWFASYADASGDSRDVVVVVFLRGGRPTFGPKAAEIAGRVYRNLYDHSFFTARATAAAAATAPQP